MRRDDQLLRYLGECRLGPPAERSLFATIEAELGVIFPGEFIDFHVRIGAVAGSLIPSGRYLELWPAGVLLSYNTGYNVAGFVPGVVLIGDNGGTTAYALDYGGRDVTYIAVPFIGLAREEIEGIASTFEAFIAALAEREVVV